MELLFMTEGRSFTLFSLLIGESVPDFLENLIKENCAEHARMIRRLERLAEQGATRRRDEFNDLGGGLYEAKTKGGARIAFFYDRNSIVICAAGLNKKSAKTPKRFLKTARLRQRAYENHRKAGQDFKVLVSAGRQAPERTP